MYIKFYIIYILIINTIISTSCTTISNNEIIHKNPHNLYKTANNKLHHKNYISAIQDLLNLQNLYLFEPCPQQIYLNLIYAYYKTNDLKSANNSINNFLKLYPNHKHLDYVLYMHGIINMNLDKNSHFYIASYFNIYWHDHNLEYAQIAFRSFYKLIKNYPNSQYIADAYQRLVFLKNRIANHDLSIIKFYYKQHAYISVITRSEKMLRYFPDTYATYQALHYMKKSYQHILLLDQADKINKIIIKNQYYQK